MRKIIFLTPSLLALLAAHPLASHSQIDLSVVTGYTDFQLREHNWPYYDSISTATCTTPDCTLSGTLPHNAKPDSPYYEAAVNASKTAISGSLRRKYDGPRVYGSCHADSRMDLYAKAPPGTEVYVKAASGLGINWAGNTQNAGVEASAILTGTISTAPADSLKYQSEINAASGGGSKSKLLIVHSKAVGAPVVIGADNYYFVGYIIISGNAWINPYTLPNPYTDFNASIGLVEAYYKGKTLAYEGGDNQTYLVEKELPNALSVKVLDGETGTLVPGVPITFSLIEPANGAKFPNRQTSIVVDTAAGIAAVKLTLGLSTGTYRVKASCPATVCVSGVNEVIFTATALTNAQATELSLVQCDENAIISMPLRNAFVIRTYNTITRMGEKDVPVNFSITAFPADAEGQDISPRNAVSNTLGIAKGSIKTGNQAGEYVFKAECPSCGGNKQKTCKVLAGLPPDMEAVPSDEGPAAGNPDETPLLRISHIGCPNDTVSFTTRAGENNIQLGADLKPDTPEYNTLSMDIGWAVTDSDTDAADSGDPQDPSTGPATSFIVDATSVPAASRGRVLPLKYKIQAGVMTPKGLVKSYPRHIKQDPIDKCRQEYFDVSATGQDLAVAPYFEMYTRSRFSPGTDGEFVKHSDCYAHIYPRDRAREVTDLRIKFLGQFAINVQSGYRSAKHNKAQGGVWNSVHQFGDAVDIQASPVNGQNMKKLWLETDCPKILESRRSCRDRNGNLTTCPLLVLKGICDGTGEKDWQDNPVEGNFTTEYERDYLIDADGNNIYDILEDLSPKNGIADVFDSRTARVIHLGR